MYTLYQFSLNLSRYEIILHINSFKLQSSLLVNLMIVYINKISYYLWVHFLRYSNWKKKICKRWERVGM